MDGSIDSSIDLLDWLNIQMGSHNLSVQYSMLSYSRRGAVGWGGVQDRGPVRGHV